MGPLKTSSAKSTVAGQEAAGLDGGVCRNEKVSQDAVARAAAVAVCPPRFAGDQRGVLAHGIEPDP